MKISERIEGTIENWRVKWGDTLKGWAASFIGFGIELFMDILGKAFAPKLRPMIDKLEESGEIPPELQPLFDELKEPSGEAAGMLASAFGYSIVGGAIGKIIDAPLNPLGYWMQRQFQTLLPDLTQTIALWLRGHIKEEDMPHFISSQGFPEEMVPYFEDLAQIRLDPGTITRIWLRDKTKYEELWNDLKQQGWTEDRIEVAKELAKIIPPLSDMVRFADFAAFDPEVIAKWRQFYDAPSWIAEPFELLGVTGEWANKYWFSHWIQPGRFELGEMHRRELIDDDAVKLAYRTMGYSPFWQDLLLDLVKAVPTRVDVRRWWDMRTIDEAELRKIYHKQGYYGKDLDNYVLWTKVYVAFPDLIARFKNGWITEDDVRSELTALGMPAERVEEMIQTKIKTAAPAQVEEDRKATATEIMKGVKKEQITWDEGVEMLGDLGYSAETAEFKLNVYIGVTEGSPETYSEFKQMSQMYRKAIGLPYEIPPIGLQEAEKALKEAEAELKAKIAEGLKEEKLLPYQKAKDDAAYRYRQLLIQWQEAQKKT